jgi:NO-binding membrane sensor protein with MHYT domain
MLTRALKPLEITLELEAFKRGKQVYCTSKAMADPAQAVTGPLRIIQPQWDHRLIVASLAISLLGTFTSSQLMCQARTSRYFSGVLAWTILGSLIFGFCSIWSLHFVATLACGLDLEVGLSVPLTVLSALLAVGFTFCALGGELIRKSWKRAQRKKGRTKRTTSRQHSASEGLLQRGVSDETVSRFKQRHLEDVRKHMPSRLGMTQQSPSGCEHLVDPMSAAASPSVAERPLLTPHQPDRFPGMDIVVSPICEPQEEEEYVSDDDSTWRRSSENSSSERSSSFTGSSLTVSQTGMGRFISTRTRRQTQRTHSNAFVATARTLSKGFTIRVVMEAFIWSMALTGMHYVGIFALRIPGGYIELNPAMVALSVFVDFTVCVVGCILFGEMETNLAQQLLFAAVATTGVAGLHFTGMAAATFYTTRPPSEKRGYPSGLAAAIVAVAVVTCIVANGLLAYSATVSRDKLAEVFHTRKKMWQAIAQKESAESAAQARSDFIASASHEIRTPLHQLQGYSDLLSRTELTDEGMVLVYAIQHATKTLSLITTNVLDWSRLEKHGDTKACQLVALDMRQVCEAAINLLPNKDEDNEAEMLVVVAPDVPHSLLVVSVLFLMALLVLVLSLRYQTRCASLAIKVVAQRWISRSGATLLLMHFG